MYLNIYFSLSFFTNGSLVPTIIVCVVVGILLIAAIIKLIKDKKKGKSSCSHNCSSCGADCPYKNK